MMIQWKKALQEKAGALATKLAVKEMFGWPPVCTGPYYQPERPVLPATYFAKSCQNTSSEK